MYAKDRFVNYLFKVLALLFAFPIAITTIGISLYVFTLMGMWGDDIGFVLIFVIIPMMLILIPIILFLINFFYFLKKESHILFLITSILLSFCLSPMGFVSKMGHVSQSAIWTYNAGLFLASLLAFVFTKLIHLRKAKMNKSCTTAE